ncbi:MAG: DUF1616 domain-containing protein [Candidatus Bathyarchaeia archaeon]
MNAENEKQLLSSSEIVQQEKPAETKLIQEMVPKQDNLFSSSRSSFDVTSYVLTVVLAVTSMISIFIFQNADNLLRAVSGLLLALGLPGYALMKAVFPPKMVSFENKDHRKWLFTGALSVVMSIIVVSLVAFALDLTPIGVTVISLNLSLFGLTIIFGTVGLWRRYNTAKSA